MSTHIDASLIAVVLSLGLDGYINPYGFPTQEHCCCLLESHLSGAISLLRTISEGQLARGFVDWNELGLEWGVFVISTIEGGLA